MTTDHPLPDRLLRGTLDRETAAAAVRGVLARTEPEEVEPWTPPAVEPASYADALAALTRRAASLEAAVLDDEAFARQRLAELDAVAPEERAGRVREDGRFHAWPVAEGLRRASLAAGTDDPQEAVALAELAELAARGMAADPGSGVPPAEAADLLALALGQRANALRVASNLRAAERALDDAFTTAGEGTGDPLVKARLSSLAASLRSDQSRFDEALSLARRAAGLYRRLGDDHEYGRTLLKQASVHAYRDDLEEACGVLSDALAHLEASAGSAAAIEPRLAFAVHHNRAAYLDRLERWEEAAAELAAARELLPEGEGESLDHLRWTWLAGRLAVHRGEAEGGEASLRKARDGFIERGLGYEAAQVSLELAALYAEQGRTAAMRRLAEEMVPLFAARDLHDEARTALALYCDAARAEAAGLRLVQDLAHYLERARHRPELRFTAS